METATIIIIPGICELCKANGGPYELQLLQPLSLIELRDSPLGKELMHHQDWYNDRPWAQAQVSVGKYAVRLPIPRSNNCTTTWQQSLLLTGETFIPVTIGALVLLCQHMTGYPDPLNNGWIRCAEEVAPSHRVVLAWKDGSLRVDFHWERSRNGSVWAGGVTSGDPSLRAIEFLEF